MERSYRQVRQFIEMCEHRKKCERESVISEKMIYKKGSCMEMSECRQNLICKVFLYTLPL